MMLVLRKKQSGLHEFLIIALVILGTYIVSILIVIGMFWIAGIPWDAPTDPVSTSVPVDNVIDAPDPYSNNEPQNSSFSP